jgi:hypothetical protein
LIETALNDAHPLPIYSPYHFRGKAEFMAKATFFLYILPKLKFGVKNSKIISLNN